MQSPSLSTVSLNTAGRLPKEPDPSFSQPQSVAYLGFPAPGGNNIFALK